MKGSVPGSSEEMGSSRPAAARDDSGEFAVAAARVANDHKAADVRVRDLRGLSSVADYFVLGTGTSDRQARAVLDAVQELAHTTGRKAYRVSDGPGTAWLLADFVDVVVHIFDAEHREYYDLDGLWGDAPEVEWGGESAGDTPSGAEA